MNTNGVKMIVILGTIILILIMGLVVLKPEKKSAEGEIQFGEMGEKQRIEAWIVENGLNQYGDPEDTVYTGGTPLFNEMTGKTLDKYEYILKNNPDRPWEK